MINALFIIHVYPTTSLYTLFAHIRAMIAGREETDGHTFRVPRRP